MDVIERGRGDVNDLELEPLDTRRSVALFVSWFHLSSPSPPPNSDENRLESFVAVDARRPRETSEESGSGSRPTDG